MLNQICFFNSSIFWGGGEKLHLDYAIKFKQLKYRVSIFSNRNSELFSRSNQNNIPTTNIKVNNLTFLNLYKIIQLSSIFRKQKTDTVIFTTSQDVKFGSFAAKLAGVKNIVYIRGLAVPIKNSFINRFIFNHILTHFVANSEETKKQILVHLKNHLPASKIQIIYHGIELAQEKGEQKKLDTIKRNANEIILGNAGRLTAQKGQKYLVEIAKILKKNNLNFKIYIAGTGEMENELKNMIQTEKLQENIILLGFVENMEAFMASIDIFLLTSIWEGFGFVLVEAMKKSKPIVAFDTSSNPEIVENGKNGYLCAFPKLDCFAEQIMKLAKSDELRLHVGENGYDILKNKFSIEKSTFDLIKYLNTSNKN